MDIVLFFQSTTQKSWREKLVGVHAFAREHNWFVQVVERFANTAEIRHALAEWHPIGCLVDRGRSHGAPTDHLFRSIPTVYLDLDPAYPRRCHPSLIHDSAATAALAGQELLNRNCASYAYIGTSEAFHWDKERLTQFKKDVKCAGATVVLLPQTGLQEAVVALPKPCGILGANDACAIKAFHAVTAAGLSIPDDVAIVGIDNDEIYCESVMPGLTSAEPDFEGAGYRLAQMLADEIERWKANGGRRGAGLPATEKYGPLRLVRRGSTAMHPDTSPQVRRAIEFIRRRACDQPLRIDNVIAEMKCSRRLGTLLFKKETGHTILDEIHEKRFERACDLLSKTTLPIATVVAQCGYRSDSFIKKMFLSRTGMTMRQYRRESAK